MPADKKEYQDIELYDEEVRGYTTKQAIQEANRCLHCKRPLCKEGCPIANDIPEFIEALAHGNVGEARSIISRKSNLPAVCGRVCAHELQCEGHCVLNRNGESIRIGMLERFIADYVFQMEIPLEKVTQKTRGKVAVIGSGPAGLTVAGDLAKMGFSVTIYEEMEEPGGVLLYGIPPFRLPKEVVRREVQRIEALGVTILSNTTVGVDITAEKMLNSGFDAVFVGTGTVIPKELNLPGKDLKGIIQSSYFLRNLYLYDSHQIERSEVPLKENEDILVVGAGNVAIDAARSALKMGAASATIVARGKEENRAANETEYLSAIEEGVQFLWETTPIAYEGEKGDFFALRVKNEEKGEYLLPASRLFLAVGSRPANKIVSSTKGIEVDADGYVIIKDRPYGMTTHYGIFAGGDVVHRPASVVLAMKEAKKVAQGIEKYIDAIKLLDA